MRFLNIIAAFVLLIPPVCGENTVRSPDELDAACREDRCDVPFEIRGTVIITPNVPQGLFTLLSDDRLISLVDMRPPRPGRPVPDVSPGDRVVACGRTEAFLLKHKTTANCHDLRIVAPGSPPAPPPLRVRDFRDSPNENRVLALRGTLQDVFPDDVDALYLYAVLKDGDSSVNLVCNCPRTWLSDFRSLLGCEVIATCITAEPISKFQRPGPTFKVAGTNAFRVVRRPSGHPFNVPEAAIENVRDPSALAKLGPQIVRGTVLAIWGQDSFLLGTATGKAVRVDLAEGPLPQTGATVEAVGIAETDLYDITLSRASWRPVVARPIPKAEARSVTLSTLFTDGRLHHAAIQVGSHGRILTVRGTVKSVSHGADGSRRLLLAEGDHAIPVVCGPDAAGDPPPEEGWRIAVTGVCVKDSDVWRPTVPIPKIRGLFLVTRTDDDIVVLGKSSWWTPARFAIALTVLLAILVAIVIWNATLRVLVARRSREVIKAQTAKLESELRIDERTRLAADLHDNTVQNLTAIAYRITAAQGALGDRESEAGRILQVAAKMLKSCRTSLRQCLWDLRNDALDEPDFAIAIRRTVETVSGDAKLSIRFSGRRDLINDTTAHAVLNILRELVSNATVHGKADSVSIAGEARPGAIRFSVNDNGSGFDPARRPGQDEGHFGLDGIEERLEALGGAMGIQSSAGKGTYVRITIQPKNSPSQGDRT